MKARGHVLELLTTQLISEYLRTVADPAAQTKWARQHLHFLAEEMPVETESFAGRFSLVETQWLHWNSFRRHLWLIG